VLFDADEATLRVVATDRHRMAVSALPVAGVEGPPVRVILPVAVVDDFLGRADTGLVGVSLAADRVTLSGLDCAPVDALYPDYQAILAVHGSRSPREESSSVTGGVAVTAPDLLEQVMRDEARLGPDARRRGDLVLLGLDPAELRVGDALGTVAFDRQYLADAVRSFGDADLLLTAGERDTLRLAAVNGPDAVVLLMPVRLDDQAA
jgi:DNA polymerase III sliding clamp (beta) subunit (PCNA family)